MSDDESNVIYADMPTTNPIPPERVIDAARDASLESVLIVGIDESGELYLASSTSDGREMLWYLARAHHQLMQMADE